MFNAKKRSCLIVINDSILNNTAGDTYSSFFTTNLKNIGFDVSKIVIIPCDLRAITQEISLSNKEYDLTLVVTNLSKGYIGPAIGKLFGKSLEKNESLKKILSEKNIPFSEEELLYPTCVNCLEGEKYPLIHIQRLFIINEKYVDSIFRSILNDYLMKYIAPMEYEKLADIYLNGNCSKLDTLQSKLVSYQLTRATDNSILVEYKSDDLDCLLEFEDDLRRSVFVKCSRPILRDRLYLDMNLKVKNAIQVIETCFERYGPENTFLSFNGGKDCTVLLHLTLTVLEKHYPCYSHKPICLYVQGKEPFEEQEEFILKCQQYYNLEIVSQRMCIKDALSIILRDNSHLKACLMGTRRTDPYSEHLLEFQVTDKGYPEVMRVNPLLNWSYYHIWDYLLYYKVPYCKLYDMGYTSLGNVDNTTKNPSLLHRDDFKEAEEYLPAYKLLREDDERIGRNS